jgi:hypothetical protein
MKAIGRFPHVCPLCASPAYLGLYAVDCSNPGCQHASAETRAQPEIQIRKDPESIGFSMVIRKSSSP